MRKIIYFIIIITTILNSESCRKIDPCACDVTNPEENLIWLKNLLKYYICEDIYQYIFEEKEYIIIETCPQASDPMKEVFDCKGTLLCRKGGISSGYCPLPGSFWETYESRKILLFKHRITPI